VGYPHTVRGAISAALNYGAAGGQAAFMLNRDRRARDMAVVGTPAYARRFLSPATDRGYTALASSALGRGLRRSQPTILRGAPLGYRLVSAKPNRVVLHDWGAFVLGSASVPPVVRFASTQSTLVWWHGDWKIADSRELGPGPTPRLVSPPTGPAAFIADIRGLRTYRYVP
jgi:hypothetical protein